MRYPVYPRLFVYCLRIRITACAQYRILRRYHTYMYHMYPELYRIGMNSDSIHSYQTSITPLRLFQYSTRLTLQLTIWDKRVHSGAVKTDCVFCCNGFMMCPASDDGLPLSNTITEEIVPGTSGARDFLFLLRIACLMLWLNFNRS